MKKNLILFLFLFVSIISFGKSKDTKDAIVNVNLKIESTAVENQVASDDYFACCNAYIVDAETGESFVAVTYCKGDNSTESYILACVAAAAIRDRILASF